MTYTLVCSHIHSHMRDNKCESSLNQHLAITKLTTDDRPGFQTETFSTQIKQNSFPYGRETDSIVISNNKNKLVYSISTLITNFD